MPVGAEPLRLTAAVLAMETKMHLEFDKWVCLLVRRPEEMRLVE
jgi:hypothetical protein